MTKIRKDMIKVDPTGVVEVIDEEIKSNLQVNGLDLTDAGFDALDTFLTECYDAAKEFIVERVDEFISDDDDNEKFTPLKEVE